MQTHKYFTLIFAALILVSANGRVDSPVGATQAGDVVYTIDLTDPAFTLTGAVYFCNHELLPSKLSRY